MYFLFDGVIIIVTNNSKRDKQIHIYIQYLYIRVRNMMSDATSMARHYLMKTLKIKIGSGCVMVLERGR